MDISHHTVALQCPTCGNSNNSSASEVRFGLKIQCSYCGTSAVVVINRRLHIPVAGEHVCGRCGEVARLGAVFCQCGLALFRKCVVCRREFSADHDLCDACGWPQNIDPESDAGIELRLRRAIEALRESKDEHSVRHALDTVSRFLGKAGHLAGEILGAIQNPRRNFTRRLRSHREEVCATVQQVVSRGEIPS